MARQTQALTQQFLTWLASAPRTYAETMDVWRSTCPRITIWEDALSDGLIQIENNGQIGKSHVTLTERGRGMIDV